MFDTADIFGYKDSIIKRMSDIEEYYDAPSYGGQPYVEWAGVAPNISGSVNAIDMLTPSKEYSMYGRRMRKTMRLAEDMYANVEIEIKKTQERIDKLASNPNKIKYEMDARNIKVSLYRQQLDIIKFLGDSESKMKKAQDDDLKLRKDLQGINVSESPLMNNLISSTDDFMKGMMGGGLSQSNNNTIDMIPSSPIYDERPKEEAKVVELNTTAPSQSIVNINPQKEYL